MHQLLWFIHIIGICLWFGITAGSLLVWPSRNSSMKSSSREVDTRTLVTLITRVSHTGAGLAALGGVALSFVIRPKTELGAFWLVSMQGLGAIAFFLSVIVLTRIGKRLVRHDAASFEENQAKEQNQADLARYRGWLGAVFILLLVCLFMAAFKPLL